MIEAHMSEVFTVTRTRTDTCNSVTIQKLASSLVMLFIAVDIKIMS